MRGNDKREDGQEISALCPSPYQCSQQHHSVHCVNCDGHNISQCNVLQNIPTYINNIQYLCELLDIITNCHLCCGNHLEQFHDVLSEEEKRVTNTAIGKRTNYNKCVMNLASFHSILQDKTLLFINHIHTHLHTSKQLT